MSTLNYLCEHDVSDDDCFKCVKYGVILSCPKECPYFTDVRQRMTPEMLAERDRLMKKMGVIDK